MSRDYKSRQPSASTKTRHNGSLIWGIFIGYALGLVSAIGVWMYLNQAPSPFLSSEKSTNNASAQYNEKNLELKVPYPYTHEEKKAQVDEKTKFDFYKILPGIEEPTTVQEFKQAMQNPPVSLQHKQVIENYFLQAGSFKNKDDAENLKARLALLGMVALIQSADLAEKGVWYRVRVGPFAEIVDVEEVRISLQQNGIKSNFIKVRRNTQ